MCLVHCGAISGEACTFKPATSCARGGGRSLPRRTLQVHQAVSWPFRHAASRSPRGRKSSGLHPPFSLLQWRSSGSHPLFGGGGSRVAPVLLCAAAASPRSPRQRAVDGARHPRSPAAANPDELDETHWDRLVKLLRSGYSL